ncbi:MAG: hypothetical protein AAF289_16370, partial [Cyanobacteria bacterium P01_A01_bin.135]
PLEISSAGRNTRTAGELFIIMRLRLTIAGRMGLKPAATADFPINQSNPWAEIRILWEVGSKY